MAVSHCERESERLGGLVTQRTWQRGWLPRVSTPLGAVRCDERCETSINAQWGTWQPKVISGAPFGCLKGAYVVARLFRAAPIVSGPLE